MNGRELVETYGDMLYRICVVSLRNKADAEDAVQEILLKYITKAPEFTSESHRKAWLITVAVNQCKTMIRQQRRTVPTDPEVLRGSLPEVSQRDTAILDALMSVPEKFRAPLILHYVEGYKISEVSDILGIGSSAVKMRLSKGRKLLETIYRREYLQ